MCISKTSCLIITPSTNSLSLSLSVISVKNIAEMWSKWLAKQPSITPRTPHRNCIQSLDSNDKFIWPNIPSKQCDYTVCWCNVYVHDKRERIINISSVSRNLSFSIMFSCVFGMTLSCDTNCKNSCNVNFSVFCLLFFRSRGATVCSWKALLS